MTFGERIKAARVKKGLSQKALSDILGTSAASVVSGWETGITRPDIDRIPAICEALDVTPAYLFDVYNEPEASAISPEDKELLNRWHKLDEDTRADFEKVMDTHIAESIPDKEYPDPLKTDNIMIPGKAVLTNVYHPDYRALKQLTKKLRTEAKKNFITDNDILRFLWRMGYEDRVNYAKVFSIMRGWSVPSRETYALILAFVTSGLRVNYDDRDALMAQVDEDIRSLSD